MNQSKTLSILDSNWYSMHYLATPLLTSMTY